jgi:hypothetical protein
VRLILLIALAWIVIYNVQSSESAPSEEENVITYRPRRQPQHKQNVEIAAAGPQIGETKVDISMEDDIALVTNEHTDTAHDRTDVKPPSQPIAISTPPIIPAAGSKWVKTTVQDPADEDISRLFMTRSTPHSTPPSTLAVVMTKDDSSWGRKDGQQRSLASYLNLLRSSGLDLQTVSLGLLTSNQSEFALYSELISEDEEQFGSATVILHPGYANRVGGWGSGEARHANNIQHDRRAEMARLRNYLMYTAMGHAPTVKSIIWIDADVYDLSENLLPNMIEKLHVNETVGLLTVISHFGGSESDYDLNAYRGRRTQPNEEQRKKMRGDVGSWVGAMGGGHHIHHVLEKMKLHREKKVKLAAGQGAFDPLSAEFEKEGSDGESEGGEKSMLDISDEELADFFKRMGENDDSKNPWWKEEEPVEVEGLMRLDAVGATVLAIKAGLVSQGLAFATSYLVGTDWEGEGWDAIESEGTCVTARTLGSGCWAMVEGYSRHCAG